MNSALFWLYTQSGGQIEAGSESCYLCGQPCTERNPVAKSIADTFNSHWIAQCRSSHWLCDACAWYLDSKAGHPDFRKMSLVVTEQSWRNWQRTEMKADIERWLAHGLEADCYLVVSLSKKKHILLQASLNAGGVPSGLAIQVEEQVAYIGCASWEQIAQPFMGLLALGHNKGEILRGHLYANTLRKHGQLREAMRLTEQLLPWRNSPEIELYSYVTILEEKEQESDDGPGGTGTEPAGSGDATVGRGNTTLASGMEEHRSRVQEPVSSGNLAPVRGTHRGGRAHDGQPASVSEPSLWDAADSIPGDG